MPQKTHTREQMVANFRRVDVSVSQGQWVAEAVRSIEVAEFIIPEAQGVPAG